MLVTLAQAAPGVAPAVESAAAVPPPSDGLSFALQESTLPGIIICGVLLVMSSFSWAVMLTKLWTIRGARKESRRFLESFRGTGEPLELFESGVAFRDAPLPRVYGAACREMVFHLLASAAMEEKGGSGRATPSQLEGVRTAIDRAMGEVSLRLESQMTLLATAVSGAPFLGLLGTVWGVMDTFSGVAAAEGAASLKSMAPGVSSALVTTVVGLLVAIPAMFGYNFLVNSIKALMAQMENFAAELLNEFDRNYIDHLGGHAVPAAEHHHHDRRQPSRHAPEAMRESGVGHGYEAGVDDEFATVG
ncbi:MAG: MotA/TolQ/ExbB proton channel family protein [Verrucomicrobiales bacterium]